MPFLQLQQFSIFNFQLLYVLLRFKNNLRNEICFSDRWVAWNRKGYLP